MDGFDFFPVNTQPSQTSATGLGHAPAPRAGLDSFDLNSQVPPAENFPHLHAYGAFLQGHGEEGAGLDHGSGYPPPRAPRTLGLIVAGWLRLHRVIANFNSAHRHRREAAAVEAATACHHGLTTVEARRPVQAAADGGARRSLRLVVIVRARPRRTVAARAHVVAAVATQGVPAILKLPVATTSTSMKKKDTKRR